MLIWIFAGLGVFVANNYLPGYMHVSSAGLAKYVGSRDEMPEPGVFVSRARRAQANMLENIPIFLTLGVLALVIDGTDMALAILGAQIFVFARIAYTAIYLISIPWTRSIIYAVGLAGCVMMALALV